MKKDIQEEQEWDIKRILIVGFFLIVGLLVVLELKNVFLKDTSFLGDAVQNKPVEIKKPNIKSPGTNFSSQVGSTVEEIKNNVSNLDAAEVATSSPQIQKVLKDIQGIKDLPSNQAREMCLKICSGI